MDGSGDNSILGKNKQTHQNSPKKLWDCENQAELPHVLSLYPTSDLSEIYR